jgi:2-methylcitrate dehydratase PrpD
MANDVYDGVGNLAARIVRLEIDDAGAPVMQELRLHVLDTLAAWIAATNTVEGKALINFRNDLRSFSTTAVNQRNLFDDATTNCALARLSEVDNIHLRSMTTPGSIVIPAALTMAATLANVDAGDTAVAILAGYEAVIRLGLAIKGPDILGRGIWPTYFTAPFGTAAVAARLLRLNERQTAHALALALTMAAPSVGQHRAATAGRWLSVGNAARNGITAAFAARSGFTGDTQLLQSRLFSDIYGINPDVAELTAANDDEFVLAGVSFKPWWAARQTMAATQALRELADNGTVVSDAKEIEASVLPPHLKMIDHGVSPGDRTSHLTSLPYQMALAALQPEATLDIGYLMPTTSKALQSLMARIKVRADVRLLADYPKTWPARVTITTPNGTVERLVCHIPGDPERAFTESDVNRKFHRLVTPVLGEAGSRDMWESGIAALRSTDASAALVSELNRVAARASDRMGKT